MIHEHSMYGFFPGGDPRRFTPDAENGEAAQLNHKAACEAFARTGESHSGSCWAVPFGNGHAIMTTGAGFGPGVYTYDCDDLDCPEAQDMPPDHDDAYAAFERWWDFDGQVIEVQKDETLQEKMREAFAAGFKARRECEGDEES